MRPKLSLKGRALKYLSAREHSRSELKAKLLRHALSAAATAAVDASSSDDDSVQDFDDEAPARAQAASVAAVEALLDELEALKFLSNERFAESLSHRRAGRFGVLRLKQELKMHQLSDDLVSATLENAKATELERARGIWSRKFGEPPANYEDRVKQHRFLASRGFSPQIISGVLKGGFSGDF